MNYGNTSLFIQVSDSKDWQLLLDMDISVLVKGFPIVVVGGEPFTPTARDLFEGLTDKSLVLEELPCTASELLSLIGKLKTHLNGKAVIFAHTSGSDSYMSNAVVYYAGDEVRKCICDTKEDTANISAFVNSLHRIDFSDSEIEYLKYFGITIEEKPKEISVKHTKTEDESICIGCGYEDEFCYEKIDCVSSDFYDGVLSNGTIAIPSDKTFKVNCDGIEFKVKTKLKKSLQMIAEEFGDVISKNESTKPYFDLYHAESNLYDRGSTIDGGPSVIVSDCATSLSDRQLRHRVLVFAAICNMINNEKLLEKILLLAQKKKDKTLFVKRNVYLSTLFFADKDLYSYILLANSKSDKELSVEIRKYHHIDSKLYENDATVNGLFF